jgi:hypothetical protein
MAAMVIVASMKQGTQTGTLNGVQSPVDSLLDAVGQIVHEMLHRGAHITTARDTVPPRWLRARLHHVHVAVEHVLAIDENHLRRVVWWQHESASHRRKRQDMRVLHDDVFVSREEEVFQPEMSERSSELGGGNLSRIIFNSEILAIIYARPVYSPSRVS